MKHNPFRALLALLFPRDAAPQRPPPLAPPAPHDGTRDARDAADDRRHRAVLAEQQRIRESLAYAQSRVQLYLLTTGAEPDAGDAGSEQHG